MIYEYNFMFENVNNFILMFIFLNKGRLIDRIVMIFLYF